MAPIRVAEPSEGEAIGGFSLQRHLGAQNARQMGFERLREALSTVILRRQLAGGPEWLNERLIGRVRYAARAWKMDISLDADLNSVARLLDPLRSQFCYIDGFGNRSWPVAEMLSDVEALRAHGRDALDPWWDRFGGDPLSNNVRPEETKLLLNEYWKRTQIVFRELVECNFPRIASLLNFFQALPT
jgi:hypothetical protein